MRARFRHLRDDERGSTLIIVGAGFMALMAATTLAIDVGMFMTARSQAQNAADAGAPPLPETPLSPEVSGEPKQAAAG